MRLVALGANLPSPVGAPRETLVAALAALQQEGLELVARSRWYRTPAYPAGSGPDFVNGAAVFGGDMAPEAVLARLHAVERALGRDRRDRWAPRGCDLDLIAAGDAVLPDPATVAAWMALPAARQAAEAPPALILPHPRVHERAFVLRPILDVAPDWVHPVLGKTARMLWAALPEAERAAIVPLE